MLQSEPQVTLLLVGLNLDWRPFYKVLYPETKQPDSFTSSNLELNVKLHGAFVKPKKKVRTVNEEAEFEILSTLSEDPFIDTMKIQHNTDIRKSTVHSILKRNKYHVGKKKQ
ncbi:hypothetical protein FQA39_LY09108 [Lamprigera yunnana]|nr:hypothetical protein FQA39_LY09108 [Lamprigera yunnana]